MNAPFKSSKLGSSTSLLCIRAISSKPLVGNSTDLASMLTKTVQNERRKNSCRRVKGTY